MALLAKIKIWFYRHLSPVRWARLEDLAANIINDVASSGRLCAVYIEPCIRKSEAEAMRELLPHHFVLSMLTVANEGADPEADHFVSLVAVAANPSALYYGLKDWTETVKSKVSPFTYDMLVGLVASTRGYVENEGVKLID